MQFLDNLLDGRRLWRASAAPARSIPAPLSTGDPAFDALLPDQGWPRADLGECLTNGCGIGELRLLMPAIAALSRDETRWVAWINPPHIPYAPALAGHGVVLERMLLVRPPAPRDTLWVIEQALRTGTCSMVLAWPDPRLRYADLRRLQLAAAQGNTFGVLFRPEQAAREASPAPLRLQVRDSGCSDRVDVRILKRRGGWAGDFIPVQLPSTPMAASPADVEALFARWRLRALPQELQPQQRVQAETSALPPAAVQAKQSAAERSAPERNPPPRLTEHLPARLAHVRFAEPSLAGVSAHA